jgi:hypothetical protein
VVAFVASILVSLVGVGIFYWYRGLRLGDRVVFRCRRTVGTPLSWGEAMVASTLVFFLLFWVYGVVPHQFLTWADGELGWRPDRIVFGPGDILKPQEFDGWLPFTITYLTIRDLIAVAIYGVLLVVNVVMWMQWQKRDQVPTVEVERSTFGRPLVREGAL